MIDDPILIKHARAGLTPRYLIALRGHLRKNSRSNGDRAQGLGRAALAGGLATLDMARMHAQAVVTTATKLLPRVPYIRLVFCGAGRDRGRARGRATADAAEKPRAKGADDSGEKNPGAAQGETRARERRRMVRKIVESVVCV